MGGLWGRKSGIEGKNRKGKCVLTELKFLCATAKFLKNSSDILIYLCNSMC